MLSKRVEFHDGKCSESELAVVEDEAIKSAVAMQKEAGIRAITDGEFRRFVVVCLVLLRYLLIALVCTGICFSMVCLII